MVLVKFIALLACPCLALNTEQPPGGSLPWQSPGDPAYKTVSSLGGQIAKRPFSELCTHKPGPGFDGYMMVGLQAHFAGGQVVLQALSSLALVKILLANAGNVRDAGSITGSGRSPGGGHSNPLQYSCMKNPMDRGAWQATQSTGSQSQTQLNN